MRPIAWRPKSIRAYAVIPGRNHPSAFSIVNFPLAVRNRGQRGDVSRHVDVIRP